MDTVKSYYQTWNDFPQPKKIKILKVSSFVCFSLFLLFVVIYGFGGTGKKSASLTPMVVFMEAMPADFQALRYLAQRRDVAIAMIILTVDAWVTNLDAAYDNVAAFLQLLRNEGYTKTFPVYYGSSVAEADDSFFTSLYYVPGMPILETTTACTYRRVLNERLTTDAQRLFGAASLLDLVDVKDPQSRLTYYDAPLNAYLASNKANFLILGPATDAATFLQAHSARRGQVQNIVVAGGAFTVTGDAQYVYANNRHAEMNFFLDPKAANYIVQGTHGRPVTLVALDATTAWDTTAYNTIVSGRASTAANTEAEVTSANVVGVALSGYMSEVGSSTRPVSVSVVAAAFLADRYLQEGSTVSNIPVNVVNGGSLSDEGRSYRPPTGAAKINVVSGVKTDTFTTHLLRVDALPLV